jgi:hypothetical protein
MFLIQFLLQSFIFGPIIGLSCGYVVLQFAENLPGLERRRSIGGATAFVAGGLVLFGVCSSMVIALAAVGTMLSYVGLLYSREDPEFRSWFSDTWERAAKKFLFVGPFRASSPEQRSEPDRQQAASGGGWFQTMPIRNIYNSPELNRDGGTRRPDAPVPANSEKQALEGLLQQVLKLQQQALRPEAEREQLAALVCETREHEESLRRSVEQVRTGTVDWTEVSSHVDALKRHQLPEDVAGALDALVADRGRDLTLAKSCVSKLACQLKKSRDELSAQLSRPTVTPEEALNSADLAIGEARQVVTDKKTRQ